MTGLSTCTLSLKDLRIMDLIKVPKFGTFVLGAMLIIETYEKKYIHLSRSAF